MSDTDRDRQLTELLRPLRDPVLEGPQPTAAQLRHTAAQRQRRTSFALAAGTTAVALAATGGLLALTLNGTGRVAPQNTATAVPTTPSPTPPSTTASPTPAPSTVTTAAPPVTPTAPPPTTPTSPTPTPTPSTTAPTSATSKAVTADDPQRYRLGTSGYFFTSPSRKIACGSLSSGGEVVGCQTFQQVANMTCPSPGAPSVPNPGTSPMVRIPLSGGVVTGCANQGIYVPSPDSPVLEYGHSLTVPGSFTCTSLETGITCQSLKGPEQFSISKEGITHN